MYISETIKQVEGPRGMHLRVGTAGVRGEKNLLLRIGEKFRTLEEMWETLLQWVHVKVDVT